MATVQEAALPKHHRETQGEKLVIAASSIGTVFEWYDLYLYCLLATYISAQFFSGVNETTGFIFALAAFAMVAATGHIYYGLWYPVAVAAATVVIGLIFLPETFHRNIDD